jgi:hypothetical protein
LRGGTTDSRCLDDVDIIDDGIDADDDDDVLADDDDDIDDATAAASSACALDGDDPTDEPE